MNQIEAKPTVYRNVRFKSRLEARWAICFDILGWDWKYEPVEYTDKIRGWKYTPDFELVQHHRAKPIQVEVKPCPVNMEYLTILDGFAQAFERQKLGRLFVFEGDFWKHQQSRLTDPITVWRVTDKSDQGLYHFFGTDFETVVSQVNRYRFDI